LLCRALLLATVNPSICPSHAGIVCWTLS